MIPFLSTDLEFLIRAYMNRFVNHGIMEKATTLQKLNDTDMKDKNNHKSL